MNRRDLFRLTAAASIAPMLPPTVATASEPVMHNFAGEVITARQVDDAFRELMAELSQQSQAARR